MRIEWRKLREGEDDYERVFGVCVLTAMLLLTVIAAMLPERFIPPCFFAQVTHVPCPTCGSYRALMLLKTGHWGAAIRTQPLMVLAGFAALIYAAYSWIVVLGRKPRLRMQGRAGRPLFLLVIAAVLANWLYVLLFCRS